jgi:hypothetical protein
VYAPDEPHAASTLTRHDVVVIVAALRSGQLSEPMRTRLCALLARRPQIGPRTSPALSAADATALRRAHKVLAHLRAIVRHANEAERLCTIPAAERDAGSKPQPMQLPRPFLCKPVGDVINLPQPEGRSRSVILGNTMPPKARGATARSWPTTSPGSSPAPTSRARADPTPASRPERAQHPAVAGHHHPATTRPGRPRIARRELHDAPVQTPRPDQLPVVEAPAHQRTIRAPADEHLAAVEQTGPARRDVRAIVAAAPPAAQLGVGGWARRLHVWLPPVPPVEDLQAVRTFPDARLADGGYGLRFTPDLRHLVCRDPGAPPWAFDLVDGTTQTGDAAQRLQAGALGLDGFGDTVIWLDGEPTADTFGVRWRDQFWASLGRRIGEFELRPSYFEDSQGREHRTNQLPAFEVFLVGESGEQFERSRRSVVRVPTPAPFHDAGLLLRGQLAWTQSQPRDLACNRSDCQHAARRCWRFQGEPSIELWHLPSGDLLWRAESCRQLIVLAHLDRAISFHADPAAPDERRLVRIWALAQD